MKERTIELRDDREVLLRLLKSTDREQLFSMVTDLSEDALRWSSPPYDESKIDRWMTGVEDGLSIVAIYEGRLVGISAIYQFQRPRQKGTGGMMIYIHQDFHGVGLGTTMTEMLLEVGRSKGLHRIGLEVVEENDAAVNLYRKFGFEVEGVLRDAYFGGDGKYYNILVMGILFSEE